MRMLALLTALFGGTLADAATSTPPILVRHDRDDARYRELAHQVEDVVVDLAVPFRDPGRTGGNGAGVLVAPAWALTAAHVAAALRPGHPAARVTGPHRVRVGGRAYEVADVVLHPDWRHGGGPAPHDIALIRLAEPVPGARPVSLHRVADEVGREIVVAGWGDTGTGESGPVSSDGVLRAATNRVDEARDGRIVFDFDAPDDPGVTDLEGVSGPGDSGGPALVRDGDGWSVVGVSVAQDGRGLGPGRYGVREHYTRVSAYADWIGSVLAGPGA